jgi:hypothetical protein
MVADPPAMTAVKTSRLGGALNLISEAQEYRRWARHKNWQSHFLHETPTYFSDGFAPLHLPDSGSTAVFISPKKTGKMNQRSESQMSGPVGCPMSGLRPVCSCG